MLHPCHAAVERDLSAWKQLKSKNQGRGREKGKGKGDVGILV